MRYALASAIVLGMLALEARAVIMIESTVTVVDSVRAQALITDPTGFGVTNTAIAIKEIYASMLIRDGNISQGLVVRKHQLTPQEAYGLGLPLGYQQPPFTDPKGPWFGLVWPYRDQYDYFPDEFDPLADDVGVPFEDDPGVYGFVNVAGISRGGPTDPVPPPGSPEPNWLDRGLTGNGLQGPATYFDFEISPLIGPFDRTVRLKIFAAHAIVVQRDDSTGEYSEILVPIPDKEFEIRLPEPATAMAGLALGMITLMRRRAAGR